MSELHTEVTHNIDAMKNDSLEFLNFFSLISYSLKIWKPAVVRGYWPHRKRKATSVHTPLFSLLIRGLIILDRLVNVFFFLTIVHLVPFCFLVYIVHIGKWKTWLLFLNSSIPFSNHSFHKAE